MLHTDLKTEFNALLPGETTDDAQAAQFVVYPDAPHAFHADYRPSFRQGPAEDGWQRCLAWFKAQGVV